MTNGLVESQQPLQPQCQGDESRQPLASLVMAGGQIPKPEQHKPEKGNEDDYFFEGAEKLLELWFAPVEGHLPAEDSPSLRQIPLVELEAMLELAHCRILHSRTNGHLDSYMLSESSMFVSDNRVILKTCGSIHLLETVNRLIELAEQYASMSVVQNVYYSRKNFLRPELQPRLYGTFFAEGEVDALNKHFDEGAAFCLGSLRDDRWFLYTNDPRPRPQRADQTLEIQMSRLPPTVMKLFSKAECRDSEECTLRAGIDQLVPRGTLIHDELFDPVGYSMNGLVPDSDEYVTIHITPETAFSYVSYETNHSRGCLFAQSLSVIECFRPMKFILTLFANDLSKQGKDAQLKFWNQKLPGYRRVNLQFLHLDYETLMFAVFERVNDGEFMKEGVHMEDTFE